MATRQQQHAVPFGSRYARCSRQPLPREFGNDLSNGLAVPLCQMFGRQQDVVVDGKCRSHDSPFMRCIMHRASLPRCILNRRAYAEAVEQILAGLAPVARVCEHPGQPGQDAISIPLSVFVIVRVERPPVLRRLVRRIRPHPA